jgi:hypothetical protein
MCSIIDEFHVGHRDTKAYNRGGVQGFLEARRYCNHFDQSTRMCDDTVVYGLQQKLW